MDSHPYLFSDLEGGQVTVRLGVVTVHGYRDLERLDAVHSQKNKTIKGGGGLSDSWKRGRV